MAIKKSELYSSLWASCDELRGGMDASQYKDYVLVMLFIKYISDKWAGQPYAPIEIPEGASFQDMVALKGSPEIGDLINKKIIAPLEAANKLTNMPDFNDVTKLGSGKEMVDRLTNLIAIFEKPELDFSKNRADGDDILGDAYEYLMRHFATESGKSKGQFYTPAEVSRTMAKIIGINSQNVTSNTTVYDPTCGSGSLLLRIAAEADNKVSLYGQEKEATTSGLARMNMIIHHNPTAEIKQGNTLASPQFKEKRPGSEEEHLKTFDYVVANPPFSDKRWSNGLSLPQDKPYNRFANYGIPPQKNGDFAYLLHILHSLKKNGKAAVILPHGVLFRGNVEAEIRQSLIKKRYIKGIIGLPANLFYGTGIPAAIILLDKENVNERPGIFMIDAGKGFVKDGNKNRLREQDIRKITDIFNAQIEIPGYSRMVQIKEIESNEYNLNIPRYIDSQEKEDIQDIEAHLLGGIPNADIDDLERFWQVFPNLKNALFKDSSREGYSELNIEKEKIRTCIFEHKEFVAFRKQMDSTFLEWKATAVEKLKALEKDHQPKKVIAPLAKSLLIKYSDKPLVDKYDIYQHLLSFWNETMQDDCYLVSTDGWKAETHRIIVKNKKNKNVDKGWDCDLLPKDLVIERYFKWEKEAIEELELSKENITSEIAELEEEHGGEEGYFSDLDKINKANVQKRLKELKNVANVEDVEDEIAVLQKYLDLLQKQTVNNKAIKKAEEDLDQRLYDQYPQILDEEVKELVVNLKWMGIIERAILGEIEKISQQLTQRIIELAERYEQALPKIQQEEKYLEEKVNGYLEKMGFLWK